MKTISLFKLSSLFELAEKHHIGPLELFASVGIDTSLLDSHDNKLTLEQYSQLLQQAVRLTGDKNFGLHQGELFKRFPNILSYVLMNCHNLKQAIEKYCRYQKIIDKGSYFEFFIENEMAIMKFVMEDMTHYNRHMSEFRLSAVVTFGSVLTGIPDSRDIFKEVRFIHASPKDTSDYNRIFQCPISFNSTMNAILFHSDFLYIPVRHSNFELLTLFERKTQEILDSLSDKATYTNKTTNIIAKLMNGSVPDLESVAAELSMGVRNLQTKLKSEGVSYRTLLNNVRKKLAVEYLKDDQLTVAEIAYLLGFSEPSVFQRAFKKWTNQTPGTYRTK